MVKLLEIRRLNALRGIAATMVVMSHYSIRTGLMDGYLGNGGGQFGVMVFFMLSGFLMAYLYLGRDFRKHEVNKYILARVARVIPLFLVVTILSFVLLKIGSPYILYEITDTSTLISHLLFLSGRSVLWTIPTEIQFYILFILLWWLWHQKKLYFYALSIISFILITYFQSPKLYGYIYSYYYDVTIIRSLPYFLTGMIAGAFYSKLRPKINHLSSMYVLSIVWILFWYPSIYQSLTGLKHEMWQDLSVLINCAVAFLAFVYLVPDNTKFVENRIFDYLGKISYSIYLLHLPTLIVVLSVTQYHPVISLIIYLIAVISISHLSYTYIESPSQRGIKKLYFKFTASDK